MMNYMKNNSIIIVLLVIGINFTNGCHSPLHGGRKKRQTTPEQESDEVDQTRALRNYFGNCLMEKVGRSQENEVDYSILDTIWYFNSENNICTRDTVQCWKDRLNIYLRPDSELLNPTKECIDQLDIDVAATGRIAFRRRQKRQVYPPTRASDVINEYATCVTRQTVLPTNRRNLDVSAVVRFVEEHTICGECRSRRNDQETEDSSVVESSESRILPSNRSESTSISARSLVSSLSSSYTPLDITTTSNTGCASAVVYPFRFEALTRQNSVLLNPITSCNMAFEEIFLPNPCNDLSNIEGDEFCNEQQSWCETFSAFMAINCEKTCCERLNAPIRDPPVPGWTNWSPWGECPVQCGQTAVQVRNRMCPLGIPGISPCDGDSREQRVCSAINCPSWSIWSLWSTCAATCGRSTQSSERTCINGVVGQNGCIGEIRRLRACILKECLGRFSPWSQWSNCVASCGDGLQFRHRNCLSDQGCQLDEHGASQRQRRNCNLDKCPGSWSSWSFWTACPVTCGGSNTNHTRERNCNGGTAGERGCRGFNEQSAPCGRIHCPTPQWADWSAWSECAWKRRTRQCVGGPPGSCPGEETTYDSCDGCHQSQWLSWGHWGLCSRPCNGYRRRIRVCYSRFPGILGTCPGQHYSIQTCNACI